MEGRGQGGRGGGTRSRRCHVPLLEPRRGRAASAASCHLTTERAWLVRQARHGLCPKVYATAEGCLVPSELAKRGRPESGGL